MQNWTFKKTHNKTKLCTYAKNKGDEKVSLNVFPAIKPSLTMIENKKAN